MDRWSDWAGLGVLALALLLFAVDATVLDMAVSAISADLAPTTPQLLWIIDMYSFVLAGLLVVMGNLGDRIGRRRLLLRQRTVAMSVLSVGGTGVPRSSMWRKAHQDVC